MEEANEKAELEKRVFFSIIDRYCPITGLVMNQGYQQETEMLYRRLQSRV